MEVSLPKDPDIREKWLKILKKINTKEKYSTSLSVCNKHFKPEDYRKLCDRPILKKGAIPQLNIELDTRIKSNENNPINFQDSSHKETVENINDGIDNSQIASVSRADNEATTMKCLKRKNDFNYDESSVQKKICCYLKNFGIFRREDFTNEIAWNRFLIAFNGMKKENLLLGQKNERLLMEVQKFQDIIFNLKKKKVVDGFSFQYIDSELAALVQSLSFSFQYGRKR